MRWEKKDIDKSLVSDISKKYGLDLLTSAILVRRGIISPSDLKFFVDSDLFSLHNPFLFEDMVEAVERVIAARDEGEKILVFGDRDADGISSTVILVEFLQSMGYEVEWQLPMGDEQYGLSLDAVEQHAASGGSLIITVDCGISNHDEIARASELGIDVIVLDHHIPRDVLPPAYAIINPKVEGSGYPFRDLAGCAVALKFIWALKIGFSDFFNREVCLLNIRPGNDVMIVEVIKAENFIVTERLIEHVVPGLLSLDKTRTYELLAGSPIYVFDIALQKRLFAATFGTSVELSAMDISDSVYKAFPNLSGYTLLRIREFFKRNIFDNKRREEIDVLFMLFLRIFLDVSGVFSVINKALDMTTMGTLSDLMPLNDENRIIVKKGLNLISSTERVGLKALLAKQGLYGKSLSTRDILWRVSPIINASGRMGQPDKAVRLFLSDSPKEAELIVEELISLNNERKKIGDSAWNSIQEYARNSFDEFKGKFVLVYDDSVQRGITGILASRLSKQFNVPAGIVAPLDEDRLVGSLRSPDGVAILDVLTACEDLLMEYGGHDFAAGFSVHPSKLDSLIDRLKVLVAELDTTGAEDSVIDVDAEIPEKWMTPNLIKVVDFFEPYGEGNSPIHFMYRNARIEDIRFVGKESNHLQLQLFMGNSLWPAVFWNASDRVNRDFSAKDRVDVLFTLGRNFYNSRESLQLVLLDIKKC
ncbi:single-stranded-DNA-specific exonuclease RecJ [Spirochaetia bacterium 38H-sp]|uniref:Single-stranded-DNA-specific exonuclease RecJ n=1 Tax=Rarispira pelagica TaxID=3141764 RepID=A0ABU9UBF9_9SPIR